MIVIKDIEMPRSCYDCPFAKNERTNDYGSFCECGILEDYETINLLEHSKSPNCPLVEQEPRWIPVSEKLPEIHQDVILSLRSLDIEIGFRAETEPYFYCHGADGCYIELQNVIAWMPLPQPYREVEE